jgi:cytochrome b561
MSQPSPDRYDLPMQVMHWAIALLVIAAFVIVQFVEDMPRGPERVAMMGLHKSIGVCVLALVVARLGWRAARPQPDLPAGMSPLMGLAARTGHAGLYLLMILVPLVGIVMSQLNDRPVAVFGLFTLPTLFAPDKELGEVLEGLHEVAGNLILILSGLHAVAALYHQYILKDHVLERMLPWRAKAS